MSGQEFLEVPAPTIPADNQFRLITGHQDLGVLAAIKAFKLINRHVSSSYQCPSTLAASASGNFPSRYAWTASLTVPLASLATLILAAFIALKALGPQ